jgi:hypothetical protein
MYLAGYSLTTFVNGPGDCDWFRRRRRDAVIENITRYVEGKSLMEAALEGANDRLHGAWISLSLVAAHSD